MTRKLTKELLERCNLPRKHWAASRDSLTPAQRECVSSYVTRFLEFYRYGQGFYLWGPLGVGKSYVGTCLCKYVCGQFPLMPYYVRMSQFRECCLDRTIVAYQTVDYTLLRLDEVKTTPFLVIDDVGREPRAGSGFFESCFGDLLRERHAALRPTVLLSHFGPQEFLDVYGEDTFSLVSEMMMDRHLLGDDMRQVERQKRAVLWEQYSDEEHEEGKEDEKSKL